MSNNQTTYKFIPTLTSVQPQRPDIKLTMINVGTRYKVLLCTKPRSSVQSTALLMKSEEFMEIFKELSCSCVECVCVYTNVT